MSLRGREQRLKEPVQKGAPRLSSEAVPLFSVMQEMCRHDPELERLFVLAQVRVALREDCPRGRGARLDPDDLLHDARRVRGVVVHVRLVSLADERLDLV
jgi:hypothetical protein